MYPIALRYASPVIVMASTMLSGCQRQPPAPLVEAAPVVTVKDVAAGIEADGATETETPKDAKIATMPVDKTPTNGATHTIEIKVTGARSNLGVYALAVFDSEDRFQRRAEAVKSTTLPAQDAASWSIDALPPGEYAVAVFHDENENGNLDRHALGFPLEPYGFSNNARGKFGPPTYEQVKFQVGDTPVQLEIQLK